MVSPVRLNSVISSFTNQQTSAELKVTFFKHIQNVDPSIGLTVHKHLYNILDKMSEKDVIQLDINTISLGICKLIDILDSKSIINFSKDNDKLLTALKSNYQINHNWNKDGLLKALFFEALNSDLKNKNIIISIILKDFTKIEDDYFININDQYWSEENLFKFIEFLSMEIENNYKSWKSYFNFQESEEAFTNLDLENYFYYCVVSVTKIIISAALAGIDTQRLRKFIFDMIIEIKNPFLRLRCKLITENLNCITDFRTSHFNYEITSHSTNPITINKELFKIVNKSGEINHFALMRFYIKKIVRFDKKLVHSFICLLLSNTPSKNLARKMIYLLAIEPDISKNFDLSIWLKNIQVSENVPANFFEDFSFIELLHDFILRTDDLEIFEALINLYFAVFGLCKKIQFENKNEFLDRMTNSLNDFVKVFNLLHLQENYDISLRILNKYLNLDVKLENIKYLLNYFPPHILSTRILPAQTINFFKKKIANETKEKLNQLALFTSTPKEAIYLFDELYNDSLNLNLTDYLKSMIEFLKPLLIDDKFHILESILNFCLNILDFKDDNIYIRLTFLIKRLIGEELVKQLGFTNQRTLYDYQWRLILKKLDTEPEKILEILFKIKILPCPIEISLEDVQNKWMPSHYIELRFAINQAEEKLNPTVPDELLDKIVVEAPFISDQMFSSYLILKSYVIPYILDYDLVLDIFYEFRQCFCVTRSIDLNNRMREIIRLRQLIKSFEEMSLDKSHPYFVKVMPVLKKLIDLWVDTVNINCTNDHQFNEIYKKYQKEHKKLLSELEKKISKEHYDNVKSFKDAKISLKVSLEEKLSKIKSQKIVEQNKKKITSSKKDSHEKSTKIPRRVVKESLVASTSTVASSSIPEKASVKEITAKISKKDSLEDLFFKLKDDEKETIIETVTNIMQLISKIDLLEDRLSYYEKLAENMGRSIASLTVKFLIKNYSKILDEKEKDKLFFFIVKNTRSPQACNRAFKIIESDIIKEEARLEDSKKKMPLLNLVKDPIAAPSRPVLERRNTVYGIAPIEQDASKKLKRVSSRVNVMEASSSRLHSNSSAGNGLGIFFDVKESIRKYKSEIKTKPKTLDELNTFISLIPKIENYKFELKNVRGSHFRFALTDVNTGVNFGTTTIAIHGKDITEENIANIYEQIYSFIRSCQDILS